MSKAASGSVAEAGAAAGSAAGCDGVDAVADVAPCACAAAASVTNVSMTLPSLTRSPTLTFNSDTLPPSGEGTSMEALSDSSVIRGCSEAMVSPGLTMISMIGTSLKSPISGTRTSAMPAGALVGAGGAVTAGFTGSEATPPPSISKLRIVVPSLTLSPILTASALTTPAIGEGTSIEALSDSRVTRGASTSTRSPGFTAISMIGTSLKSPISGTRTLTSPITALPPYAGLTPARWLLLTLSQLFHGGRLSASMPNLVMASAT